MKTFVYGSFVAIALTIASGVVQGLLSNRWGGSDLDRQIGAKLESLPEQFANWELKKSSALDKDAIDQLEPYGYIQREYVNRRSGASIGVLILVGPSGPISVHTPEVCFESRDHQQLGERVKISIPARDREDTIWKTTFRLSGVDGRLLNIYYAWSTGGHWQAAENPRFSLATRPYLYKIQITNQTPKENGDDRGPTADAAMEFLTDIIPILQNYLKKAS
jgi:hypothetical protein